MTAARTGQRQQVDELVALLRDAADGWDDPTDAHAAVAALANVPGRVANTLATLTRRLQQLHAAGELAAHQAWTATPADGFVNQAVRARQNATRLLHETSLSLHDLAAALSLLARATAEPDRPRAGR